MFESAPWFDKLPDKKLWIYKPNMEMFFRTMYERQKVWARRFLDELPRPWTDDPILRDYKFTNVYRELDRNSQWQIKNIYLDEKLSLKDLVWKMMFFRFFNNPETFEYAQTVTGHTAGIPKFSDYNEDEWDEVIGRIRKEGKNPFTNAYLINSQCCPGKSRDYCYTRVVIPALHEQLDSIIKCIDTATKAEQVIKKFEELPAVAGFISHEFFQDFTYIERYTRHTDFFRFNQNDYTNVGPGASIGLRLIFPSLDSIKRQKNGIYWLQKWSEREIKKIEEEKGEPFDYLYWDKNKKEYYVCDKHNITLHQIEMWLCEYQKYWKMQVGLGKQRSSFNPKTKKL